ncbi:CGGC domain-containing protein [Methanolapillus millepedarum]|uniref:CGGC domain-containing protein n=1 Tax=Methanolapillus millepedarum TaxID=3028296 RepID=A0AA96V1F4_9EURY|nr:hypothetical protein MsAc7_01810 [Methanosarcinaceae archaeon Ac7]
MSQETQSPISGQISEKPLKIALVRCHIVAEVCPGIGCFKAFNNKTVAFSNYNDSAELIAAFTCGGCSGRRVHRLCKSVQKFGADVVHLSSCMCKDMDGYSRCPHIDSIKKMIEDLGLFVVEGTHH